VVSPDGALRPTTDHVVAWCGHHNAEELAANIDAEVRADLHPLLSDLVILDTPDLDSDMANHQKQALDLIERIDGAIFVTTPARYSDQRPWEALARLRSRQIPFVIVLNRCRSHAAGAVPDAAAIVRDRVERVEMLSIAEQRLDPVLPGLVTRPLQEVIMGWLGDRERHQDRALIVAGTEISGHARLLAAGLDRRREAVSNKAEAAAAVFDLAAAAIPETLPVLVRRPWWAFWRRRSPRTPPLDLLAVSEAIDDAVRRVIETWGSDPTTMSWITSSLRRPPDTIDAAMLSTPEQARKAVSVSASRFDLTDLLDPPQLAEQLRDAADFLDLRMEDWFAR
jgi:hypothetical protein